MKKAAKFFTIIGLTTLIATNDMTTFAKIASDGYTKASDTVAAQNGKYLEWQKEWKECSGDWTQIALTPGENESEMNFAWYSKEGEEVTFQYSTKKNLKKAKSAHIKQQKAQNGYVSNYVTLKGLKENQSYYYQVTGQSIQSFTTKSSDSYQFLFVGDPQIGSSNQLKAKKPEDITTNAFLEAQYNAVENDSFNWNNTLERALEKTNGNISFILSAGDQIQTNATKVKNNTVSEIEYAGFLSPSSLRSLPVATTVGNHDADNSNYNYHFNLPNQSELGSNDYVDGDYSFTYGNTLFLILNTQDTESSEHDTFIQKAIEDNPDCKWRVVTLHQDIYGSAEHSNEPEIVSLRYELVPILEKYDIDVVLTGHDHAYTRSQLLKGGNGVVTYSDNDFEEQFKKDIDLGELSDTQLTISPCNINWNTTDQGEKLYLAYLQSIMDEDAIVQETKNSSMAINPEGILYMTAGSSSGSKYYDLVGRQQSYVANRWQEDVPTYSIISMDNSTFTIDTYRTDTNEAIDTTFTIVKTVDKTKLGELISKIERVDWDSKYIDSKIQKIIKKVLKEAKNVYWNDMASCDDVEKVFNKLKEAYQMIQ